MQTHTVLMVADEGRSHGELIERLCKLLGGEKHLGRSMFLLTDLANVTVNYLHTSFRVLIQ